MDDLQFLSAGNIDDRVNAALGAKPKSQVNPNNLGNIRPTGQNEGFLQPTSREQGISDIDKNLQAYGSKHGIDTLRGVISRWAPSSENDTESYVNTVSKRLSLNPDQKIDLNDPAIRHVIAAGIMLQEKGPSAIYGAQKQQQAQMPSPLDDLTAFTPENIDKRVNQAVVATDLEEQKAAKQSWAQKHFKTGPVTDIEQVGKKFAAQNNQDFQNAVNTIKGMSIEDWKKNSLIADVGNYYANAIKGDEKATNAALDSLGGKLKGIGLGLYDVVRHPVETLKGIEKHPLTTAAEVGKATVYDPETLLAGGPAAKLLGRGEKLGVTTAEAAKPALVEVPAGVEKPTYLRKQFEAKGGKPAEPVQPTPKIEPTVPEETPAIAKRSAQEMTDKEQLLRDVGVKQIRKSAIEGNPLEATSQYLTSKAEKGIYGEGMRQQIAHEKSALQTHFGNVENEIGGTVPRRGTGFEVSDEIGRGKTVKNALNEGYQAHVKEGQQLYKEAETAAGDRPVQLPNFQDYINRTENFAYENERGLQNGIKGFMQRKGFMDKDGNVQPLTVAQAEEVRQYINSKYHHETAGIARDLKGLIDNDVFQQVGGETYEKARAHWKAGKDIYDNPKAIGDLMSDNGVNQKIADEKVMNKIVTLDQSQFNHLLDTLRKNGSKDAVKEIQTNLITRLREAGQSEAQEPWNSRAVAKERAKLSEKLNKAFEDNPEVLDKINKGVLAGNELYIPTRYPGAAVQTHLLHSKFGDIAVKAGTWIGAKAGPTGAVAGEYLGEKVAKKLVRGKQTKQLEKEIKYEPTNKISDIGK